jgi:hypothetical protein
MGRLCSSRAIGQGLAIFGNKNAEYKTGAHRGTEEVPANTTQKPPLPLRDYVAQPDQVPGRHGEPRAEQLELLKKWKVLQTGALRLPHHRHSEDILHPLILEELVEK